MNFNKEIAKIISRPIHDTGCRLQWELLYAIEPLYNIELSHGIGWSCSIELSNGLEPPLNRELLHGQRSLYGIGWSFFKELLQYYIKIVHIELLLQLCGIGWPYGIGMLYSGLGLGLEWLYGMPIGWSYGIGLSCDTEPLVDTEPPLHTGSPIHIDD